IVDLRIKDALKGVAPPELMAHGVPIADLRLKERMRRRHEILTVAAPYRVDLMRHAGRSLIYAVGQERALFEALVDVAKGGAPAASGASTGGSSGGSTGGSELGLTSEQLSGAVGPLTAASNAVIVLTGAALGDVGA